MRRTIVALGVVGALLALAAIGIAVGVWALFASNGELVQGGAAAQARIQLGFGLLQIFAPVGSAAIAAGMAILALLSLRVSLRRARGR